MKILSVNNFKGGSGKTSVVISLAYELAKSNIKILVIDLDPQANLSSKFVSNYEQTVGSAELLAKAVTMKESIQSTNISNLDIVTSKLKLIDTANAMHNCSQVALLHKCLQDIKNDYDIVILDNSPMMPILFKNCIYASDYIIIPVNIDTNAIKGVDYTISKAAEVVDDAPVGIMVDYRIIVNMVTYTGGQITNNAKDIITALRNRYGDRVFDNTIRLQSKPAQDSVVRRDYFPSDENTSYGDDIKKLVNEIKEKVINA